MEDYRAYLQTGDWGERRAACLKAAGYRCVVCNSWRRLQAHHRTYERVGFELPGDLTCLCRDCHEAYSRQWPELRPGPGPEPEPGPEPGPEPESEMPTGAEKVLKVVVAVLAVVLGLMVLGIACAWLAGG